ncbi:MAG: prephenate dehydrogenase/arogenate dehydrogenase family protein [Lachnospiraceae bacterium]|nr:prephenate dehydrogenase/arogenate dehydrogenase family protein [Lachnospiraceae bacterium]
MTVGIAGAGLIGGSMARAYKAAGHRVLIFDSDRTTLDYAVLSGVADGELKKEDIGECDLIIIALYPTDSREYLREIAPFIRKDTLVTDCGGTKSAICKTGFELAGEYGFTFAGGHPMAGTHMSGFKYSSAGMFVGAPMVVVIKDRNDIVQMQHIKEMLSPPGFGRFVFADAAEHDRVVAFTSQLAHVASSAYIKSPTADHIQGISAGSYKDMTRVAYLNETMWADLFLDNRDNLLYEIDNYINALTEYRDALRDSDADRLRELLREGRERKERIDGVRR